MLAANTKERIVAAALKLFNVNGVQSISTNHIADRLSISPGNLYYHFANKQEIVRAIFPQIEKAAHAAIVLPERPPLSAERLGAYYRAGLEGMWDYRFFYSDVATITRMDPNLRDRYRELHRWLIETIVRTLEILVIQGEMRSNFAPAELRRIAVNILIVWFAWVDYVHTTRHEKDMSLDDMAEGALQSFLILAPHLEEGFRDRVRAVIEG